MLRILFATLILSLVPRAVCLQVTGGSPCAAQCEGPSATYNENLTCNDAGYSSTHTGEVMKTCLECENTSTAIDKNAAGSATANNDLYWYLCKERADLHPSVVKLTGNSQHEIYVAGLHVRQHNGHTAFCRMQHRLRSHEACA